MTRAKRPILGMLISALGFAGLGFVIWKIPPGNFWVESAVLMLFTATFTLTLSWLFGKTKWAVIVTVCLLGLLIMRRLQILDILTGSLWLLVLGLISLVI